ncbi:histidine phosphatase family protein [soil metagenome]|jgi:2,3-bisphosphoglycerate-dependent phosphoglycerate mutase/probable phosphoglycerate mutase
MRRVFRHTHVKLVRHPQTDWNREGRHQGHADRPLTGFGEARARAVASRLRAGSFTVIISSGLSRTDELARAVLGEHPRLSGFVTDERWREVDHGLWEGLTYTEVAARYGAEARERFADFWNSRAHGGESGADLWSRVESAWDDMLVRYDGGRVLVVTHATPIRLLLCSVLDVPLENHWRFRVDPGGITSLDLYPSATIVRTVNEVPPLERSTR